MRFLKPFKRLKEPVEPTRLRVHPRTDPEKRAEIEEAQINREHLHAWQMERYHTRKIAGVIGECRHCGINVYRNELPADMALPCEVAGCPFRHAKNLHLDSNSPVARAATCARESIADYRKKATFDG